MNLDLWDVFNDVVYLPEIEKKEKKINMKQLFE